MTRPRPHHPASREVGLTGEHQAGEMPADSTTGHDKTGHDNPAERQSAGAWQQPIGHWRERGASETMVRIGLGAEVPPSYFLAQGPTDRPADNPVATAIQDSRGYSAWHYWAHSPDPAASLVRLLDDRILDHQQRDVLANDGSHPWQGLALHGQAGALICWMERFGVPDLDDRHSSGVLRMAAWSGDTDTVRVVLDALGEGCGIGGRDEDGLNALIIATHRCDHDGIRLLVQAGANVDSADDSGRTALHHAAIDGDADILALLEHAGGNADILDKRGMRPVQYLDNNDAHERGRRVSVRAHWRKRWQAKALAF